MVDSDMVAVVNRRRELLAELRRPRHKRDLVADLDVSRSTLDRAIRELDALGLVERGDGYALTLTGRLVLELFEGLLADLDDVAAARELLGALPRDAPMAPAMVRGATVHVADQPARLQVLEPILELFDDAVQVRGFSVAETNPDFSERRQDVLDDDDDVDLEVVYDRSLADHLREHDRLAPVLEMEWFSAHVHPDVPYGLGVVESESGETAFLVCYDGDRTLRGVVVNDEPAAVGWAEAVFERYREAADPLEP